MNPYLFFKGNCEEAFTAYAAILGGRITALFRQKDAPPEAASGEGCAGGEALPPEAVLHASLTLEGMELMGSDCPPSLYLQPQGFAVQYAAVSPEESERIFAALAEGGQILMPMAETFWSLRFGMAVDRFGTPWMINCRGPVPGMPQPG